MEADVGRLAFFKSGLNEHDSRATPAPDLVNRVRRRGARSAVDGGHHLRPDGRELRPPRLRVGLLLPQGGGLVDGPSPRDGTGGRRPGDGGAEEEAGRRSRPPPDKGTQYTALSFGRRLEEVGIVPSMGRTGSALDEAISESFVATMKVELVHTRRFPTCEAARSVVFEYLEAFYNRGRLHSSLGYVSPEGFGSRETKAVA